MSQASKERLGAQIQAYVRARWGGEDEHTAAADLPDAGIRERIDILGLDGERLLAVGPEQVVAELARLEAEAAREDARVEAAAAAAFANRRMQNHVATNAPRRSGRMRPGRHRQPTGRGGRRQRGER